MKKRKYMTLTEMGMTLELPKKNHGWTIYIFKPGIKPQNIRIENSTRRELYESEG